MIEEIRADRMGVIWMGSTEQITAVNHSPKCGIKPGGDTKRVEIIRSNCKGETVIERN